jgi:pimeloyl-ACP methyl ester carboxylesterase
MVNHPIVKRRPVSLDDCFGWFHTATAGIAGDVVAVICAGVGRDSSTGYRSSRFLADRLALAGYPAVRFSYPGTGDSRDLDGEDCWPRWIAAVHCAIDRARMMSGCKHVLLIGIRLGAALGAQVAAAREDVVGLVLLEPAFRGSSFVTQLRIEEKVSARGATVEHEGVRIHGLSLTETALAGIAGVDLRRVVLHASCKVLLLSDSRSAVLQSCEEAWRRQGVEVMQATAGGMEAFFRPTHLADEPMPDLQRLMLWLQDHVPVRPGAASAPLPIADTGLRATGWIETPHFFGADGHLFGILCEPEPRERCERVVIIGNAGGDPHDGFARFAVEFARRLAQCGIASFRIDFAGLGDSINALDDPDGLTHTFTVDRRADFAAAIDALQSWGFRTIAVHGLCSGAYHALQAAVFDPRVSMLLCVNLPWFNLRYEKAGPASFAQWASAALSSRGANSLLLFAEDDAGIKPLEQHFGAAGHELAARPGFEITISPDLDHDLTRPEMQHFAANQMIAFLRQDPLWGEPGAQPIRHRITEGVA